MSIKKKVIILVSVCLIVLIGAIIGDKIMGKSYLNKIELDNLIEKIDNKEDFILLVSQTTCSHCASYKPKLEKVTNKYKLNIYYIEADLLTDEEEKKFKSYITFDGTPVTLFFRNGEEKTAANRINGNASTDKIEKKLKSNGFID
jgi:predicted bacteriocin transport accessory protein